MIDTLRHLTVLDIESAPVKPTIDIIGLGATGSRIAMEVARLGFNSIRIWDDDIVEEHNVANQTYFAEDIKDYKAMAAFKQLNDINPSMAIYVQQEKFTGQCPLNNVVFLLTDTMKSRKEIFESSIKYKPNVKLMIETRMGADSGQILAVNPMNPEHIKRWEASWFPDEDAATESACGARTSVGATAGLIAMLAVWELIKFVDFPKHDDNNNTLELAISIRPPALIEV